MAAETVYFIRLGNLSYYKIGFTRSLDTRLTMLENGLPLCIELIAFCKSPMAEEIERAIHIKFSKQRTRGEWFKLTSQDVEFIKNALRTLAKSKTYLPIRLDI